LVLAEEALQIAVDVLALIELIGFRVPRAVVGSLHHLLLVILLTALEEGPVLVLKVVHVLVHLLLLLDPDLHR